MTPEFSRVTSAAEIGSRPRQHMIEADEAERAALAARFGLVALDRLTAALELCREAAGIRIKGQVHGSGEQACVTTGEPVPFMATDAVMLLLTESLPDGDEIELADADLDSEMLLGDSIDMGEIAAQALVLALNPYPRAAAPAPGVISEEQARLASSPFAVLKKL